VKFIFIRQANAEKAGNSWTTKKGAYPATLRQEESGPDHCTLRG
jgi:hypothetical protein